MRTVTILGARETAADLRTVAGHLRDIAPVLRSFGAHMRDVSVPANFAAGGRPAPWPRAAWGLGEKTLLDTGGLMRSASFEVVAQNLFLVSKDPRAAAHQYGAVIVPRRARYLVRPIVGPNALTRDQARGAKPRDFSNLFVLMRGPEGPGLYRRDGREVHRVFAFMRSVTLPERPWLLYQDADVEVFVELTEAHLFAGLRGVAA